MLFSSYLQDERTIINGAFFLALGILASERYLASINLSHFYWCFQILTGVLICLGVWEIHVLVGRKMPILVFFYNYFNISKNTPKLEQAIRNKDWDTSIENHGRRTRVSRPPIISYLLLPTSQKRRLSQM